MTIRARVPPQGETSRFLMGTCPLSTYPEVVLAVGELYHPDGLSMPMYASDALVERAAVVCFVAAAVRYPSLRLGYR